MIIIPGGMTSEEKSAAIDAHYAERGIDRDLGSGHRIAADRGEGWLRMIKVATRRPTWWEIEDQDGVQSCMSEANLETLATKEYVRVNYLVEPPPPMTNNQRARVVALLRTANNDIRCKTCGLKITHSRTSFRGWVHDDADAWAKNVHTAKQPNGYAD